VSDKSVEEQIKEKAQEARKLARYMSSIQDLVENQIQKAQERGDFNNLKGAGKPLQFYENPYEPPELRMAFKILKDHDFAPYWIELGKDIDFDLENFRKEVESFKRYTVMFYNEKRSKIALKRYEKKKAQFYFESRLKLEKVNRMITDYNLHCPTFRVGRGNIAVDDEMLKLISEIEKLIEEARRFNE